MTDGAVTEPITAETPEKEKFKETVLGMRIESGLEWAKPFRGIDGLHLPDPAIRLMNSLAQPRARASVGNVRHKK